MSKRLTIEQLQGIADKYSAALEHDAPYMPVITMPNGEDGFEATSSEGDEWDGFSGFSYFGLPSRQADYMAIWSDLTDSGTPESKRELLTVERAQQLIGKILLVSYHDTNEGTEIFELVGLRKVKEKMIGQTESYHLLTKPIDKEGNFLPITGMEEYSLDGMNIAANNRMFFINGKLQELARPYSVKDVQRIFKTENVIYIYHAKTGDIDGLEVRKPETEDCFFEWQGIFRRGSGAERLFIEKTW